MSIESAQSRRNFIKLAAMSPLFPYLRNSVVMAQGAIVSPKLLIIFTPHGVQYDLFKPEGSQKDFQLGPILQSLTPFKDKINIYYGLRNEDFDFGRMGHRRSMAAAITGVSQLDSNGRMNQGYSLDQRVGDEYLARGIGKIASLNTASQCKPGFLYNNNNDADRAKVTLVRKNGELLLPECDPTVIFSEKIAPFLGIQMPQQQLFDFSTKKALIEASNSQYSKFASMREFMSVSEQQLLDQMLQHSLDLAKTYGAITPFSTTVAPPEIPDEIRESHMDPSRARDIFDHHLRNIVFAFETGICHSAVLHFLPVTSNHSYGLFAGSSMSDITEGYHGLSHQANQRRDGVLSSRATKYARCVTYNFSLVAHAAEMLQSRLTADGGNLLDNTVILWVSENGDPYKHAHVPWPAVTVGGTNFMDTGNYFELPHSATTLTHSYQDLLTTLYQKIHNHQNLQIVGDENRFNGLINI